jgi:hypothetical protein
MGIQGTFCRFLDLTILKSTDYDADQTQNSAQIYVDVRSSKFHRVTGHPNRGVLTYLTGSYIILPTVPWAGNDFTLKGSVTQRSASMNARVIDGVKRSADVGDCQRFASYIDFPDRPCRDLARRHRSHKRHPVSLGASAPRFKMLSVCFRSVACSREFARSIVCPQGVVKMERMGEFNSPSVARFA